MDIKKLLMAELPQSATRIYDYELVEETITTQTYKVTYKEVICGISGMDTEFITIKNPYLP